MRRASAIAVEAEQIGTIEDLTGVFESIASTKIAKIKTKVELSTEFFHLLWQRYSAIRVDPKTRITNPREAAPGTKPNVSVIISAGSGLSGDIDQRLIETLLTDYHAADTDLIVLGDHGAQQLMQRGVHFIRFFRIPETDSYIDVSPVIDAITPYAHVTVYYEEYVSLGVQDIKKIDLISNVREMSEKAGDEVITDPNIIFEPSLDEIANQMEATMMSLALSQVILESSLAQDASRFNAMAVAKKRAQELVAEYKLDFHRAKRSESDRRLREVMVSLKKKKKKKRQAL